MAHPRILSKTKSDTRHGQHQNSGLETIAFQSHTLPSILQRISTRSICLLSFHLLSTLKQAVSIKKCLVSIRNSVRIRYLPHFPHSRHSPHKTGQCSNLDNCRNLRSLTTQFKHNFGKRDNTVCYGEQRKHPPTVGFDVQAEGC